MGFIIRILGFLPILIFLSSGKTSGSEKLAWVLAVIFFRVDLDLLHIISTHKKEGI